jgi:hypothetical protein
VEREMPLTGDPVVDVVLADLETIAGRPLPDQVPVIDAVQAALADRLAETDG